LGVAVFTIFKTEKKSKVVVIVAIGFAIASCIAFYILQNIHKTKELQNQANILNETVIGMSSELKKRGYYDNTLFDGTIRGSSIASDGSSCTSPVLTCEPPSAINILRISTLSAQSKQSVIDVAAKFNFQPLDQNAVDSFMESQLPRIESRQKVEIWFKNTNANDSIFAWAEFSYIQDGDYYQLKLGAYNLSILDNIDKQIWIEDRI
jgi:hypothetical protein